MACSGWCAPTVVYMILAVISIFGAIVHPEVSSTSERILMVGVQIVATGLWTFLLYTLCANCYEGWAWFLFLIPLFLAIFVLLFAGEVLLTYVKNSQSRKENMDNYPFPDKPFMAQPGMSGPVVPDVCGFSARPARMMATA